MEKHVFTKNWFEFNSKENWEKIIPIINPTKILEIGSYEGAASCYLIDVLSKNKSIELHCIDTWEENDDIKKEEESDVESRFDKNIKISINNSKNKIYFYKYKNESHVALSKMIISDINNFDLIYIDASHYAPDVLSDAVIAFKLLKPGGMLIFDDYLWSGDENIVYYPKIAIDAFTNIFSKHIKLIPAPLNQIYVVKIN